MASYNLGLSPSSQLDIAQRGALRLPDRNAAPVVYRGDRPTAAASGKLSKRKPKGDKVYEQPQSTKAVNPSASSSRNPAVGNLRENIPSPAKSGRHGSPLRARAANHSSGRAARTDVNRTPSLVSAGSSASTMDSPRSNSARQKPAVSRSAPRASPSDSTTSHQDGVGLDAISYNYKDPHPDTVLGIPMPTQTQPRKDPQDDVINLDPYIRTTPDGAQAPALYALSVTPSTGYSPGPFSVTSTPTSMSSNSSSILLSADSRAASGKDAQSFSRSRQPTSRRLQGEEVAGSQVQGLSTVRESSSSSTSTLRATDNGNKLKEKSKVSRMPAVPPSPRSWMESSSASSLLPRTTIAPAPVSRSHPGVESAVPVLRPPEFAHLERATPSPQKSANAVRPIRPSREGTPDMNLQQASPVVQSNMSTLPLGLHRRQLSSESKQSNGTSDARTRLVPPKDYRRPSPSPSQASTFSPTSSTPPTRGVTPDYPSDSDRSSKAKASPSSAGKPFSRFGFFSKKGKSDQAPAVLQKERPQRKGPIAGTGHEGYGKFALRGRSGSTTSGTGSTSVGRSPSADSASGPFTNPSSRKTSVETSDSDVNDSATERTGHSNIRRAGSKLPAPGRKHTTSPANGLGLTATTPSSSATSLQNETNKPSLLPSAMADAAPSRPTTSHSQKKGGRLGISTFSSKRTSALSFLDKPNPSNLSSDRKLSEPTYNLSRTTTGTSQASDPKVQTKRAETLPKAQLKQPKRWNIFQRSRSPERQPKKPAQAVPVMVARQAPARSVAHYAMLDAPVGNIDAEELERIMQEADLPSDGAEALISEEERPKLDKGKKPMHGNSVLLPEPPVFVPDFAASAQPGSPKVSLRSAKGAQPSPSMRTNISQAAADISPPVSSAAPTTQLPQPAQSQPRPSRLQQVGRIPQVVSRRDQERKLSETSFSRPFGPGQPSPALRSSIGDALDLLSAEGPAVLSRKPGGFNPATQDLAASPPTEAEEATLSLRPTVSNTSSEFFSFPPRMNSQLSTGSSSSGIIPFVVPTALLPDYRAPLGEEEIWGEYDDLLDTLSPKSPKTPASAASSHAGSFPYSTYSQEAQKSERRRPAPGPPPAQQLPKLPADAPSVLNIAEKIRVPSTSNDSRYFSNIPPLGMPTSPLSVSEFFASYGERNLSVIDPVTGRLSIPSTGRISTRKSRMSLPPSIGSITTSISAKGTRPSSNEDGTPRPTNPRRDSRFIEMAENEQMGLVSAANLRFAALMTSKWLSFGRVLFSPAHFELKNPAEDRVLIIDGLGKDWSYFVAENYPTATIYNLGSDPPESAGNPSSGQPLGSPPNHRHFHYPATSTTFPFPRSFFAVVVFRFPIATSEAAYRNSLLECKRVLRPGGYLELSVLDIDMLSMGNRARRAVRQLKMEMAAQDPSVSLKPLSDTMQRLLGRRGFENLQRCILGVPVAGRVPGSREDSIASSGERRPSTSNNTPSSDAKQSIKSEVDQPQPTFGDIFREQSQEGDEGITKMVARVGRWWYLRCYESVVLPNGDVSKSIWNDEALVTECEKRGTSLRLMVCCAQKPDCPVRRTISV